MMIAWLLAATQPVYGQGAATLYVQEVAPSNPPAGAFWYQPSTSALRVLETTEPLAWGDVGGGAAWGAITGTLSNQTDLQTALDGKQAAGSGPSYVVTTQDTTNATTSYANITGLVFNVAASTRYKIACELPYDANATTTGIGVSWVGPASPTLTRALMTSGLTAQTVGATTIVGNDTGSTTTASVATTNNIARFEGIWSNGSNAGSVQIRVKSEVAIANAIIVRTGAMCSYAVY